MRYFETLQLHMYVIVMSMHNKERSQFRVRIKQSGFFNKCIIKGKITIFKNKLIYNTTRVMNLLRRLRGRHINKNLHPLMLHALRALPLI